jgi:hemolysin activation/secretion protein
LTAAETRGLQPLSPAFLAIPMAVVSAALAWPVHAAEGVTPPSAGSVLRDLQRPEAPLPRSANESALPARKDDAGQARASSDQQLLLKRLRFTGATVFTASQLQAAVADGLGRTLDLDGLQALVDRVTRLYRDAGYPLARAVLPAQDIVDGEVQVQVVEGRLGAVTVRNATRLQAAVLPLDGLQVGSVIADAPLERALLLTQDLAGVRVRSTLQPGATVGTSELLVELSPGQAWAGSVEADNQGSPSTGLRRLGGSISLNNAAGLGDVLSLRALGSEGDGLRYGRLSWQVPVGAQGSRLGVALSDMRYRLGGDFEALQAHGSATVQSLFASHPLRRSRSANLNVQLQVEDKRLRDLADAAGTASGKALQVATLSLSGDASDSLANGGRGGWNSGQLSWAQGRLRLGEAQARELDAASAQTAGEFGKLQFSLQRLQNLPVLGGRTSLMLGLSGQWAQKNLDSSEKFALGGAGGVRAYHAGVAAVDRALLLTLEWRQALAPGWQASVFMDTARGTSQARSWDGAGATASAQPRLQGAGIGLSWTGSNGLSAQLQAAQTVGRQVLAGAGGQRRGGLQVQLQWQPATGAAVAAGG